MGLQRLSTTLSGAAGVQLPDLFPHARSLRYRIIFFFVFYYYYFSFFRL